MKVFQNSPLLALTLAASAAYSLVPATSHAALITGGSETQTNTFYAGGFAYGYDFVSTTNQSLTALGIWDQGANGLPGAFQVGLWATSTQTLLATATIDSTDALDLSVTVGGGNWRYETLGSPVSVSAGTTYTIGWFSSTSLSTSDSLLIDYPTLTTAPAVSVPNLDRFLPTGSLAFPSSTFPANSLFYAQVNAQFAPAAAPAAVPEPGTALAGVMLVGLLGVRRKRASV